MKNRYSRDVFMNIALISQLGISMMVPVFGMLALGIYLQKITGLFLAVPFLIIGMLAGMKCVMILAQKSAMNKSKYQKDIAEENETVEKAVDSWNRIKHDL